jgi:hypothetical protein
MTTWVFNKVGNGHIHCQLKCFDNKNVAVDPSEIEIHFLVQGDEKATDRLSKETNPLLSLTYLTRPVRNGFLDCLPLKDMCSSTLA